MLQLPLAFLSSGLPQKMHNWCLRWRDSREPSLEEQIATAALHWARTSTPTLGNSSFPILWAVLWQNNSCTETAGVQLSLFAMCASTDVVMLSYLQAASPVTWYARKQITTGVLHIPFTSSMSILTALYVDCRFVCWFCFQSNRNATCRHRGAAMIQK